MLSLPIKIAVCIGMFMILLAWGWYMEQKHQRLHQSPTIDRIVHHHGSQDVTMMRADELDQSAFFLPRQYVKIIRYTPVE